MKYWRIIPNPAALVCPKTCDTVAEDAYNIASHLSSDRTHDERGILRQARYIEAVLKHTCQRITQLFKCEVRSPSFLFPRDSWLQFAGHSHVQVASVYGKGLFETLYKQVLWNIHESGSWFLSQQHWSVPRHVILQQKMLVRLPVTFPVTVLTMREENAGKRGIFRQSWSRLSRELLESFSHPSFTPFGLSPCLTHGPDLTRHIHSSLDQALLWGNQWNKSKLCSEQRQIRSFARLFKALSLRPTFQPTSTPEQASRLLVKMQRRFLNKRSAIRTAMRNTQSPADLCNWCQHWIEYCSSVCLIPSVAYCLCWQDPLVRLWPCLDSASVHSRESLVAIRLAPVWAPVILSAKCVVAFVPCGRKPPNFFECEVRSHSFLFQEILGCNLQGTATCRLKGYMGKACLKPSTCKYCGTFTNLVHDSYPSSIGLSQDMWHCGRRCL